MNDTVKVVVKLPAVTLSYPHLFAKRAVVEGDTEKFSASFILDATRHADTIKELKAAVNTVKTAAHKSAAIKPPAIARGEDKYPDDPDYEGTVVVSGYNHRRPVVVDINARPVVPDTPEADLFYGGAVVNAQITLYPYFKGGKGVAVGVEGVQWLADGERRGSEGGGGSAAGMFEPMDGEGYGDKEIAGLPDDAPLVDDDDEFDW